MALRDNDVEPETLRDCTVKRKTFSMVCAVEGWRKRERCGGNFSS